jgi:sugar lactone lactonase YvrE
MIRELTSGIGMGESPRWYDGALWLADWTAGVILRVDSDGTKHEVARVGSFPITFDWLPDGRMLAVSGRDAEVLVVDGSGGTHVYADLAPITPTPWNEIATDTRGNAYVNGIGFDYGRAPEAAGSIALIRPDGEIELVATGLAFPNGMIISPDGATLVVAESNAGRLAAFAIDEDATLTPRAPWAELDGAAPDGICWGADGAIWFADVPNRCCTLVHDGGRIERVVDFDIGCFSCVVGSGIGEDGDLYVVTAPWPGAIQDPTSRNGHVMVTEA